VRRCCCQKQESSGRGAEQMKAQSLIARALCCVVWAIRRFSSGQNVTRQAGAPGQMAESKQQQLVRAEDAMSSGRAAAVVYWTQQSERDTRKKRDVCGELR